MIQSLQQRIIESSNPVGMKRVNSWCLPPKPFSYGLPGRKDKEGVSKRINCLLYIQLLEVGRRIKAQELSNLLKTSFALIKWQLK